MASNRKSVVLLGKGTLAIQIADWFCRSDDYQLRCVVPVIPEPSWTDSLSAWCRDRDVPLIESGDYEDVPDVQSASWNVSLAFSVFYSRIIPPWFIERCGHALNLHNAPLPHYRGCNPINWALKNGETTHGVTIHELTSRVDAGPIVSQARFAIDPRSDEVADVYERSLSIGFTLFERTISVLDRLAPRPQDESQATYYRRSDAKRLGDRKGFTRAESDLDGDSTMIHAAPYAMTNGVSRLAPIRLRHLPEAQVAFAGERAAG